MEAHRRAVAKGARGACELCKRPINLWGLLTLRYPGKRSVPKRRRICYTCWAVLDSLIDRLEAEGQQEREPVEELTKEVVDAEVF